MAETDIGFLRIEVSKVRVFRSDIISNSLSWFADYGYLPEKTLWTFLILFLPDLVLNLAIRHRQQNAISWALEEVYLQDDKDPWTEEPSD